MAKERQPANQGGDIAVGLSDLHGLAEADDTRTNVALQKRDEAKFATRAIRPCRVTQLLCQGLRSAPRLSRQRRIEIFVGLALDCENAKAKTIVRLDERML